MDKWKKRLSSAIDQGRAALDKRNSQGTASSSNYPGQQQPLQGNSPPNAPQGQPAGPPQGQDQPVRANPGSGPIIPKTKREPEILGLVGDPSLNRDSGGSVRFGDRLLWTYRDTQLCNSDGSVNMLPIITSTASWSDYESDGRPKIERGRDPLNSVVLRQYGKNSHDESFFPSPGKHLCHSPAGNRDDGTRIALWPNQPPLVTSETNDGNTMAYTWVPAAHINQSLGVETENPSTILYKTEYHPSRFHGRDSLPKTKIVAEQFWKQGEIAYGAYGTLVHNGYAWLWGQWDHKTALARVRPHEVENRGAYEYWVHGQWTRDMPKLGQDGIEIQNANAGGQGTYFFNKHWNAYTWIGGDIFPGAETYVCTAPEPQGPWTQAVQIYTGPRGNHALGAYSVQAHPDMVPRNSTKNEMYITYTKNDEAQKGEIAGYTTPLVYVEFE
ncbi:hypothetical protein CKM354_000449800 [Cercospora kikuchii]|uniref:DUF4185 domain-containing protein n=1 Tax=Cercospora kikuchii TaxID=84275 RepID=A0A9P3CE87_9PEZI|nr:uncharacterized protein CKM354_000449800 [Cercospora kikuchii]GIZ41183.1 hypothetical protein CKM354_000449800 [Cercospora kikuchii]